MPRRMVRQVRLGSSPCSHPFAMTTKYTGRATSVPTLSAPSASTPNLTPLRHASVPSRPAATILKLCPGHPSTIFHSLNLLPMTSIDGSMLWLDSTKGIHAKHMTPLSWAMEEIARASALVAGRRSLAQPDAQVKIQQGHNAP